MIQKIFGLTILIFVCALFLFSVTGCEGAGKNDREAREKLEATLTEWNTNGTYPISETDVDTTGYLKEWSFKYAKMIIVFDGLKAHPVISRSVLERIAVEWYGSYPENIKPRFKLKVTAYIDAISNDAEWGWTEVDKKGKPETHWYKTDVY